MFGYIRPHKSELLVREYEQYKAAYCQLCRVLGQEYGLLARFSLSYDCTFYALLALSVSGAEPRACKGRCAANPLKRCMYLACAGEEYKKAAALTVLLTYHKLLDDIQDEKPAKAWAKRLLAPFVKGKARRAEGRYPFLAETVRQAMQAQKDAEGARAGVDGCAEPTANMLAAVFRELAGENAMQAPALERFGYFLGRWVYLMDAADDLPEDLRAGRFNPFIPRLGLEGKSQLSPEERAKAEEACNEALNATAAQMALPLNLLELENFGPIIENIVQKGLPGVQREILFLHIKEKPRRELENL